MQEYKIFHFDNETNNEVVFINSVEDLHFLVDDIYNDISKNNGTNFSVLVDLFLRNGFSFNRYVLLSFDNGKYKSMIINPNDVSEEIKRNIRNYLKSNSKLLDNSSLPKKMTDFIKVYN